MGHEVATEVRLQGGSPGSGAVTLKVCVLPLGQDRPTWVLLFGEVFQVQCQLWSRAKLLQEG